MVTHRRSQADARDQRAQEEWTACCVHDLFVIEEEREDEDGARTKATKGSDSSTWTELPHVFGLLCFSPVNWNLLLVDHCNGHRNVDSLFPFIVVI